MIDAALIVEPAASTAIAFAILFFVAFVVAPVTFLIWDGKPHRDQEAYAVEG